LFSQANNFFFGPRFHAPRPAMMGAPSSAFILEVRCVY
jgi:hypothetical protein